MSRRWFVSWVGIGASADARTITDGRPSFTPKAWMVRTGRDGTDEVLPELTGPSLQLAGPGDAIGFDRSAVIREEPPAGCQDAVQNNLACVEFADASLPWLLSLPVPGGRPRPWLALLVLREDEAELTAGSPLPRITAPGSALFDLADAWAWAHVEARTDEDSPDGVVTQDVRSGLDTVISRLICPRRLQPRSGWLACVVPTTRAGVAAGFGTEEPAETAARPAWEPGQYGVPLPVYHSWRFRTGEAGSFEDLARKVQPVQGSALPGFGSRQVNVRRPWPQRDLLEGAAEEVTVTVQGALRLPQTEAAEEQWSDPGAQQRFRELLTERLNAPASRRDRIGAEPDRDEKAVAPPLYGSHHSGTQTVPDAGWMNALNLQARHRIAAALGARYVQLEQEFLMARAWEQVGAINEANRLLAASELAEQAGSQAQSKHLASMNAVALTTLAAPMRDSVQVDAEHTLGAVLDGSAVPDGAASTAFIRLTRSGGGLARRTARAAGALADQLQRAPVLTQSLAGQEVLPAQPTVWLTGTEQAPALAAVAADQATAFAGQTLIGLLQGQRPLFAERAGLMASGAADTLNALTDSLSSSMGAAVRTMAAPTELRGLRRSINDEALLPVITLASETSMGVDVLAQGVLGGLAPMPQQLDRIAGMISGPSMNSRGETDQRPLRPIMAHPRFGFPIAVELLSRWPEWAVPGISTFPENSCTLLETNSAFIESLMVGLNQEFNRELLWREYPTDQAGTAFGRFWPPATGTPDFDEIARWSPEVALGDHDRAGGKDLLVLLVRAEVLRRYPGTLMLAAKSANRRLPDDPSGTWLEPKFFLPFDERTSLYAFDLTADTAIAQRWMFVLREPMRGTQFGFDIATEPARYALPGKQDGWRWCNRCQCLFYAGFGNGICHDGNPHDSAGSWQYSLAMAPLPGAQPEWYWCSRCQILTYSSGGANSGVCQGGGQHDLTGSGPYWAPLDPSQAGMQDGWRWCGRCQNLAFGGAGAGPCAAGGAHEHGSSGAYRMAAEEVGVPRVDTWADLTWNDVPLAGDFVLPRPAGGLPPAPSRPGPSDPPEWGRDAADQARIAFQRPFQLAFSPRRLIGEPPA